MLSDIATLTLLLCFLIILFYVKKLTRDIYPCSLRKDIRKTINTSLVINAVFFTIITLLFYKIYGYIADDTTYFGPPATPVKGNIFKTHDGTLFLQILVGYIRSATGLDLPAFHILFATISFIAGLLFIRILLCHIPIISKRMTKHTRIALWSILCFPNIIAWGRFFGKDSIVLSFAAIWFYNTDKFLFGKATLWNYIGILFSGFIMYGIRAHIAMSFMLAFSLVFFIKVYNTRNIDSALRGLIRLVGPYLLIGITVLVAYFAAIKIGGRQNAHMGGIKSTVEGAAKTGAYGGSARKMDDGDEVSGGILSPQKILANIGYLYFAPFPWQVRGAIDIIALLSNVLLFYLLWNYVRNINRKLLLHIYLLTIVGMLTLLLSFLTGNVGLILREKTIMLPFLFLLLFTSADVVGNPVLKVRNTGVYLKIKKT